MRERKPEGDAIAERVEILRMDRAAPGYRALRAEWAQLSVDAPPFLGPDYCELMQPLLPAREVLVVAAREASGRLTAVLPLVLDGRALRLVHGEHNPRCDLVGDPAALGAMLDALDEDQRWARRWDRMELEHVRADSPLVTRLPELARRRGCMMETAAEAPVLWLALPDFEAHLPQKMRAQLHRCERKAGAEYETLRRPTRHDLDEAFALEGMAWKAAAGTAIDSDPSVRHFYLALARRFARRDRATLHFVRSRGRRIAAVLCLEDARTVYALKLGYHPDFADVSPGHLAILAAARDGARRGFERLDFLGRESPWKAKWTHEGAAHARVVVYRATARGYALAAWRALKPHLPPPLVSWVSSVTHAGERP